MKSLIAIGLLAVSMSALADTEAPLPYVDLWQLHQEAQGADPRILRAQALTRSGDGNERAALGRLLPQLNASSSVNRSRRDDDLGRIQYNGKRMAVVLNQVLYDPQVWRSYQKYVELAQKSQYESDDTQVQSSIDLSERYFAVLAAEDELSLVRSELAATERNLKRIKALYARQMAMVTDTLDLEARVDALKADEIEAGNKVQVSREAISELVGRDVQEPLKRIGDNPAFTLPPQTPDDWIRMALDSNPALHAREHNIRAAEAAIGEAKAGHLPRLGLNLTAQRSDIGYEGALTPRSDNLVASLDLQVPLYSGGSTSARVSSSESDREVAQQELEALRRQVVKETRTAYLGMMAELSRIKATRRALESAEKSRTATEKAFGYGVKNAVDVLDSIKDEFRARRDFYQSQYRFVTSLLVLHRWSGRLGDGDIRKTNEWLVAPNN
ncbi:outer membrane protein [Pseudomonas sp. NFACC32-1]|uniref:TolC family outer membrane protein n=1 Tax=Pseudomonas TaxID=286 RepID=UPI0008773120|nr:MULTISPECIES: TolC family outer membrane protein [Pseudomonas]MDB6445585.1 TolC family outer membrane protein [Pseudomonas sp. 21TX0197]NHN68491.1 TolC family outer membrane protein [Pseudomonas fluorescens]ROO40259.1 channel protein TolC [Pseudomonas sp. AF76]SCX71824.1 outer membrane protein [Pseudomonas sp. NFACC32-1]SFW44994.1 outer membrane protein [Pseudomonas sp. NFACC09-4]